MKLPNAVSQLVLPLFTALAAGLAVAFFTGALKFPDLKRWLSTDKIISPSPNVAKTPSEAPAPPTGKPAAKDSSEYVAVYLTNGKVYFGKSDNIEGKQPVLTDVYFLRVTVPTPAKPKQESDADDEAKVETAPAQPNFELVRHIDQFPAPAGQLTLSRDHILFWEELPTSSKVIKAIETYKSK